jgi:hypothetical protein
MGRMFIVVTVVTYLGWDLLWPLQQGTQPWPLARRLWARARGKHIPPLVVVKEPPPND